MDITDKGPVYTKKGQWRAGIMETPKVISYSSTPAFQSSRKGIGH